MPENERMGDEEWESVRLAVATRLFASGILPPEMEPMIREACRARAQEVALKARVAELEEACRLALPVLEEGCTISDPTHDLPQKSIVQAYCLVRDALKEQADGK